MLYSLFTFIHNAELIAQTKVLKKRHYRQWLIVRVFSMRSRKLLRSCSLKRRNIVFRNWWRSVLWNSFWSRSRYTWI